jgi:hypothetical protein
MVWIWNVPQRLMCWGLGWELIGCWGLWPNQCICNIMALLRSTWGLSWGDGVPEGALWKAIPYSWSLLSGSASWSPWDKWLSLSHTPCHDALPNHSLKATEPANHRIRTRRHTVFLLLSSFGCLCNEKSAHICSTYLFIYLFIIYLFFCPHVLPTIHTRY